MKRLLAVLRTTSASPTAGGDPARPRGDRAALAQEHLTQLVDRLDWMIKLAVGLLVVVFAAAVATALGLFGSMRAAGLAAGGLGLGASACIWWLILLWRERTATVILLHFCNDLVGSERDTLLQQLIRIMLDRLQQSYPRGAGTPPALQPATRRRSAASSRMLG